MRHAHRSGTPAVRPAGSGAAGTGVDAAVRSSIRGSTGMMLGYGLSLLASFVIQILLARHLAKAQFGALTWALSGVTMLQAVLPLGVDRASARFVAMYDEHKQYAKLFGYLVITACVLLLTSGLIAVGLVLFPDALRWLAPSGLASRIFVILVALAPIQAIDAIVVDLFAVLGSPVAVFVRRYLIEPGLRLAVVLWMVSSNQDASFVASGYLAAGAVAMSLYLVLAIRLFRRTGLLAQLGRQRPSYPWRGVAGFCGPVFLSSLVATGTTEMAVLVLGRTAGAEQVAAFRAVQPFAVLNVAVMFSFTTLYTPTLSRLVARGEISRVRELYWQSAAYIAVLTFPVVATLVAFPQQVIVTTVGPAYRSSAIVLVLLSIGFYVNACLGFNGLTTQVLGRSRWVMVTNLTALVSTGLVTLLLVPAWGPVGGALSVLFGLVLHNVLKQVGLGFGAGVGIASRSHTLVLAGVSALTAVLAVLDRVWTPPLPVALLLVLLAWAVLLRGTRRLLNILDFFPELARLPLLRKLGR